MSLSFERVNDYPSGILLICRAQEVCESSGGGPGHLVPNSPYDLCGCKAIFEEEELISSPFQAGFYFNLFFLKHPYYIPATLC